MNPDLLCRPVAVDLGRHSASRHTLKLFVPGQRQPGRHHTRDGYIHLDSLGKMETHIWHSPRRIGQSPLQRSKIVPSRVTRLNPGVVQPFVRRILQVGLDGSLDEIDDGRFGRVDV